MTRGNNFDALRYRPELDGIRALAVLAVVAFHAQIPGSSGGFFGVDMFFVLSGYLITRLLVAEHSRTGGIALGRFYLRRLRRLYPAMALLLVVFLLVAPWAFPETPMSKHLTDAFLAATYLTDYSREMGIEPGYIGHFWSLAVEEHFYLVWPLILLALLRMQRREAVIALAAIFILATGWRIYAALNWASFEQTYFRFDMHASGLALGCLAGFVNVRLPSWVGWAGLAGLAYFATQMTFGDSGLFGFTAVEAFSVMLILGAPAFLGSLAWLGRMSYGWYLWHAPIMAYGHLHDWEPWTQLIVGGVGGLALACASYYTIEARFRSGHPQLKKPGNPPAEGVGTTSAGSAELTSGHEGIATVSENHAGSASRSVLTSPRAAITARSRYRFPQ